MMRGVAGSANGPKSGLSSSRARICWSDNGILIGGRETVMCSAVVGRLRVGAGALISAAVPSQAATAAATNPARPTATRAERGQTAGVDGVRGAQPRTARCAQRCGDAVDDVGGNLWSRRRIGAQGRDVAADPVQRVDRLPGVRVCADLLAQPGGGVVVEKTCLQIGEGLHRQRWIGARIVAIHPAQLRPSAPVSVIAQCRTPRAVRFG